jgi:uncharacterized protein with HEPN domain
MRCGLNCGTRLSGTLCLSRDWQLYWLDIKEAANRIVRYSNGLDRDAFEADDLIRDAVLRNLEVIGEAAKHIPEHIRAKATHIEWRKIVGFRDIVAHAYFGIDDAILWDIVSVKVPELLAFLGADEPDK